jgi:hypothetical protein
MDSSYYKKVSDLVGEDNIQLAIASVFDNAVRLHAPFDVGALSVLTSSTSPIAATHQTDALRKEFQDFRKTAQFYVAGLNFFLDRKHDQTMNAFKLALVADSQVQHMEVKRANQIMCSIKFCLHVRPIRLCHNSPLSAHAIRTHTHTHRGWPKRPRRSSRRATT